MGRNKCALKSFEFYNAINELGITINDIAVDMCIPIRILEDKLQKQEPFCEEHIRFLTYKFGANIMFDVIYFPDKKFREQVYRKVFLRGGGKRVCHKK